MQQKQNLNGLDVWVTRPSHQAEPLQESIAAQGGHSILFPVLEIQAISPGGNILNLCHHLDHIDYIVFISPNAVEHGVNLLLQYADSIPERIQLVTIGQASNQKLQQLTSRTADISPLGQYNSETLLAHPLLHEKIIRNKQFLIFRGLGGRELLAEVLTQRGAKVTYVEVYQRLKPVINSSEISTLWHSPIKNNASCRIIILNSNAALLNLIEIFKQSATREIYQQLLLSSLIVITEKMRLNALRLGFTGKIVVADKSSNEAICNALIKYKKWVDTIYC